MFTRELAEAGDASYSVVKPGEDFAEIVSEQIRFSKPEGGMCGM